MAHGSHEHIALHTAPLPVYIAAVRNDADANLTNTELMDMLKSYSSWRKYRETCIALGRLSERDLADIGITRKEIRAVARRGFLTA